MSNEKFDVETIRHSLSHIMAAAVMEIFPEAKFGIGPATDNGFYYDFDLPRSLTPSDLIEIEKKMKKIISSNVQFLSEEITESDALKHFADQPYKLELVKDLANEKISIYKLSRSFDSAQDDSGTVNFVDLCKGPHVQSATDLKNSGWKLDKIAGAYWKGSEKNKMLQRIYALAFESSNELEKYLENRQEAEKRDHRKIGAELDLFSFHDEGPGFPFFHPKGIIIWNQLLEWWRKEHFIANYKEIKTPIILARELWEKSGHWDHYKDNMYFTKIDDRDFAVKPMNCPGALLYYKEKIHSYKEFPLKIAEIGLVHRHELAGVLHGLMRVRSFHQDDAHIFCLPEQIEAEVSSVIDLIDKMYTKLNLKYHLELSTRPLSGSIGSDENWEKAESSLKNILNKRKIEFKLNDGDGAFYGPKIDFHIEDAIGRTWQTATIQLDFSMPERFNLAYIDSEGKEKQPVMIHRVVFGAIERFIGILLEHTAGVLPNWLAPIQTIVLPISDKHLDFAEKTMNVLKSAGVRAELDNRSESIGRKIRDAEIQKIPFMLIIGDKETESNKISVRKYSQGDLGQKTLDEIIKSIGVEK